MYNKAWKFVSDGGAIWVDRFSDEQFSESSCKQRRLLYSFPSEFIVKACVSTGMPLVNFSRIF